MKLHYKGKYNLNPESLPHGEHMPGAVKFKEADSTKQMGWILTIWSMVIAVTAAVPAVIRCQPYIFMESGSGQVFFCCLAAFPVMFLHEFLHAICFKGDVYLYTNLKQGMLLVVGTESMSKGRFVMMSLLPNVILGIIPYAAGLLFPNFIFFAVLGVLAISMGAGDYYNVFHAVTQMPKGARTYLHKFNSYWYMP